MTPLPKRKLSRKRQGKRRASVNLLLASLVTCANCGKAKPSHKVCPYCGFYKGKKVSG